MIPNLDLLLSTIERALEVTILPNAANASAREEAGLAILFTRWLRDVVDDVPVAERQSLADCRAALDDVTARLEADPSSRGTLEILRAARATRPEETPPPSVVRDEGRKIKSLLGQVLRALRASGNDAVAGDVRAHLFDLGVAEIERERSFGRASAMDPDWRSLPRLAELRKESK